MFLLHLSIQKKQPICFTIQALFTVISQCRRSLIVCLYSVVIFSPFTVPFLCQFTFQGSCFKVESLYYESWVLCVFVSIYFTTNCRRQLDIIHMIKPLLACLGFHLFRCTLINLNLSKFEWENYWMNYLLVYILLTATWFYNCRAIQISLFRLQTKSYHVGEKKYFVHDLELFLGRGQFIGTI